MKKQESPGFSRGEQVNDLDTLRVGSLFSGYGGLDLALEAVFPTAQVVWTSDIDSGARKVLASRYPDAPNLGDVTRVDWSTVPPVDLITGGSPCPDLSTAGRRAGMTDGTRSNLWVTMREAIAHVQPTYVVWENVRGSLSAKAASDLEHCPGCMGSPDDRGPVLRALGRVLGDLGDLGFDAEWHGLRASDVGACHQRFRVFVLAWRRDAADADHAGRQESGRPIANEAEHAAVEHAGAAALRMLPTPRSSDTHGAGEHGTGGPDLRTVVTMLPTPAAGAFNDGEDVDAWQARRDCVKAELGNGNGFGMPLGIAVATLPTPSVADATGGHERRGGARGGELLLKGIASHEQFGQYAPAVARQEVAFGHPAPSPTEPGKNRPRLAAAFAEWMMGLPPGWVTDVPGVTRNEALRLAGNGVVPQQAAAALADMLDAYRDRREAPPTTDMAAYDSNIERMVRLYRDRDQLRTRLARLPREDSPAAGHDHDPTPQEDQ
ncbi:MULTISPECIES: DNA cytosine methyltransferase [Bacillati]